LRNSLIRRFENLIELAAVSETYLATSARLICVQIDKSDRNTTALHEYQTQIETAGLVSTAASDDCRYELFSLTEAFA